MRLPFLKALFFDKKNLITMVLVWLSITVFAQFPKPLKPPRLFNNVSKVQLLNKEQERQLEEQLVRFEQETSNEISIIVIDDLLGYEPSNYAFRIGEAWGVGKKKEDNGVVILVKPNKENGGRHVFIAVGRGLEGVIPDLMTNEIVNKELLPNFKENRYFEGLSKAVDILTSLAKQEFDTNKYLKSKKEDSLGFLGALILLIFIIVIVVVLAKKGGGGGRGGRGGGFTIGDALIIGSMFANSGRGHGGGFGGGSGGGGFGGFGGGSFGGGGSGGSW
jgi:uncharacterized protein